MTLIFLEIQIHREGLTVNTIESNMKDGLLLLWKNITKCYSNQIFIPLTLTLLLPSFTCKDP